MPVGLELSISGMIRILHFSLRGTRFWLGLSFVQTGPWYCIYPFFVVEIRTVWERSMVVLSGLGGSLSFVYTYLCGIAVYLAR